jgi:hypothetical protein
MRHKGLPCVYVGYRLLEVARDLRMLSIEVITVGKAIRKMIVFVVPLCFHRSQVKRDISKVDFAFNRHKWPLAMAGRDSLKEV